MVKEKIHIIHIMWIKILQISDKNHFNKKMTQKLDQ